MEEGLRVRSRSRRKASAATSKKSKRASRRENRRAGGSAVGGGIDFQAAVAACVAVCIATGEALGWFPGVAADVPVALDVETGGSGDDLGITLQGDQRVECQAKKGLSADDRLWDALIALARGLHTRAIHCGALIVCPETSGSIRQQLRQDLARLGDGRTDRIGSLAQTLRDRLAAEGIALERVAAQLRIVTMHCIDGDTASIDAARSRLKTLCADPVQARAAWDVLYQDAVHQIARRGRRVVTSVASVLTAAGVEMRKDGRSPVAIIARLTRWAADANATFTIHGVAQPLELDAAWIPIEAGRHQVSPEQATQLPNAIERYCALDGEDDRRVLAAQALGWFVRLSVVQGGPGMGKSTLATILTRGYAMRGHPVLRVSLKSLAARMRQTGQGVLEGLLALGLDGSGVASSDVARLGLEGWTLVCDGLDETAEQQAAVCQGLLNIVAAHAHCRVIVTTRPIGYQSALLGDWAHYELLPLDTFGMSFLTIEHAHKLIEHVHRHDAATAQAICEFLDHELKRNEAARLESRSPLVLSLMVSLALRKGSFGSSRVELYERLFEIYAEGVSDRSSLPVGLSREIARRFLDVLGWNLQSHPALLLAQTLTQCAEGLSRDLDVKVLRAREVVEQCLTFWENRGMVERLRVGSDFTLTFVHRTFVEYAAARYFTALPAEERRTAAAALAGHPDWEEVLDFASALGGASDIVRAVLDGSDEPDDVRKLVQCIQGVVHGKPEVSSELRREVFRQAMTRVDFRDKPGALEVGGALVSAMARYAGELTSGADALMKSRYPWAQLTGWTLTLMADGGGIAVHAVVDRVETLPEWYKRLADGASHTAYEGESALLVAFGSGAAQVVLNHLPPSESESILRRVFSKQAHWSVDVLERVSAMMQKAGRAPLDYYQNSYGHPSSVAEHNEGVRASENELLQALVRATGATPAAALPAPDEPFPHLSAVLNASGFWTSSAWGDFKLESDEEREVVAELLRGIAGIAQIPSEPLGGEAMAYLAQMANPREGQDGEEQARLAFERTLVIDTELDPSLAASLQLSVAMLERGLLHHSDYVTRLAAYLLVALLKSDALGSVLERTLPRATEAGLWAASSIARQLPRERAVPLLLARLEQPLTRGCNHLFDVLTERVAEVMVPERGAGAEVVIRNGLLASEPEIAISAAKFLDVLPDSSQRCRLPLLREAYAYWREHEGPPASIVGPWPASPRDRLLLMLLRTEAPSLDELFAHVADLREDVRNIARPVLILRLHEDVSACDKFIEGIATGLLMPGTLRAALSSRIEFSDDQCQKIRVLLKHSSDLVRYAAMGILDERYLPKGVIVEEARVLVNDALGEIRERALALLP